ncbi:MAG: prepilin-type N-terminal cleavage/methylation domain-containing protein [Phycisphaeraceae bacterium]
MRIRPRTGFTVPEMLAVVAIVLILLALLMPMIGKARDHAQVAQSAGNLHQIQLAMLSYGLDHRQYLPPKFEVKKNVLSSTDYFVKGKRLNTTTLGIQTVMDSYCGKDVFRSPCDTGDYLSTVPVHIRKGTSYEVKGNNYNDIEFAKKDEATGGHKITSFFHKRDKEIARDVFKPWEADDPSKVLEKIYKNELGPIKWRGGAMNMVFGDGHVATVRTKEEEKLAKGKKVNGGDDPDHFDVD